MSEDLEYFCDEARHLICIPYTVENLHRMAQDLGIKACWYHRNASYPHYDIPKKRIAEIQARCTVISTRGILSIIKAPTYKQGQVVPDDSENNSQAAKVGF